MPKTPTAPDSTTKAPQISVVIPVYNEAAIVEGSTRELCAALSERGIDYEVLLSENGSKDSTPQIVEALAKELPRVKALHSSEPNYGKAMKKGILEARGTYVICEEIDLCDVDFHVKALSILESGGAEMVVGSKAAKGSSDQRPLMRRLGTRSYNGLLRVALKFKGTDTHGLKAFKRERLIPVVNACVTDRDVFASEFVIRAGIMKRKVVEIPISLHEKRLPSVNLYKRVPKVLRNLATLFVEIRIKNRNREG
jgi:glycosyltransferase involved in cell wall biosynthesis